MEIKQNRRDLVMPSVKKGKKIFFSSRIKSKHHLLNTWHKIDGTRSLVVLIDFNIFSILGSLWMYGKWRYLQFFVKI